MSDDITPAELADYDQIHAETLSYLDAIIRAMRDSLAQDKPRPLVVAAMAAQFARPHANTPAHARLRETRDLTLGDLGDVVGVTRQRVGDWMRNEHEPRARQLFELFAALGYDLALIPKDTP